MSSKFTFNRAYSTPRELDYLGESLVSGQKQPLGTFGALATLSFHESKKLLRWRRRRAVPSALSHAHRRTAKPRH
jgi:hypothetical protein